MHCPLGSRPSVGHYPNRRGLLSPKLSLQEIIMMLLTIDPFRRTLSSPAVLLPLVLVRGKFYNGRWTLIADNIIHSSASILLMAP